MQTRFVTTLPDLITPEDYQEGKSQKKIRLRIKTKEDKVEWFIETFKESKESVEFYSLTLENLTNYVQLPPIDEKILIETLKETLNIKDLSEKLYTVL